jgi:hypothetical protein
MGMTIDKEEVCFIDFGNGRPLAQGNVVRGLSPKGYVYRSYWKSVRCKDVLFEECH